MHTIMNMGSYNYSHSTDIQSFYKSASFPAGWKLIFIMLMVAMFGGAELFANSQSFSDTPVNKPLIHWQSFQQTDKLLKENPKKVFITLYTSWCKWCKKLEGEVLADTVLSNYINGHYYAIRFNAESKEDVSFFGQTFSYDPIAKVHSLALALMEGEIGYPSSFILNEELELLQPVKGFVKKEEISPILQFYGDNHYKSKTWEEYKGK